MSLTTIAIKQIAKELQKLEQSPPEDIQVILNEDDLTHVQAWIRGPGKNFFFWKITCFAFHLLLCSFFFYKKRITKLTFLSISYVKR